MNLVRELGPIAAGALNQLLGTVAAMAMLALGLGAVGLWLSPGGWRAGVAVTLTLLLSVGATVFLVIKRALLVTVKQALVRLGLGRRVLSVVFERMLGVDADADARMGERGGRLARTIERVPLVEAEAWLKSASAAVTSSGAEAHGLRGRLAAAAQRRIVAWVEHATLKSFREDGADVGGVDLMKVRERLDAHINDTLLARIDGVLLRVTGLTVMLLSIVCLGVDLLLARL